MNPMRAIGMCPHGRWPERCVDCMHGGSCRCAECSEKRSLADTPSILNGRIAALESERDLYKAEDAKHLRASTRAEAERDAAIKERDELKRLATAAIAGMSTHTHDKFCYGPYQPCGEHHAHDDKCGNTPLRCSRQAGRPEVIALSVALRETT